MTQPITMSASDVDERDELAVLNALRSGVLALGPSAEEFERRCAEVAGTKHAVAVSSGTAGLHLIVHALGIVPGDEVLVPSFTFASSVNAILYAGATPVFVDIEPDTFNVDPKEIRAKRTRRTKAAMVVDVFGHPADWDAIEKAAEGLILIDDSCEAIGATYRGRRAGSFGIAGCFAFYPNKQITTGEGGMIVTNDGGLADLCRSLRNQGRGRMGAWLEHERLGFNYRMDEMSAALGTSQIGRLDEILSRRAAVADMYAQSLSKLTSVFPPIIRPDVQVSWFVYVVTLAPHLNREVVIDRLADQSIPTRAYFSPIHRQPYLADLPSASLPVTEEVAATTLALPFHSNLSSDDVAEVTAQLRAVSEA
jgi:perosamine synthetase